MIEIIISFLLASYLMIAVSYTLESWIDVNESVRYWYLLPFVFFWCLLICWVYFPCDVGFKLYKKLNDEEKEENK
jgi:hypothetical protein